ncbi:MAG: YicC family protein [Spirochaetaceae bacterium]|nr:YicC family protein [Spirochaetaceae bacterium]
MRSMTGYGWIDTQNEKVQMTIELKSYNNRYLDININLPPFLSPLEPDLRSYLKNKINRGRVELYIRVKELEDDLEVILDKNVVTAYKKALLQIAESAEIDESPRLSHFLHLDGVMKIIKKRDIKIFQKMIYSNFDKVWTQYDELRVKEGEATWEDIMSNIDILWKSKKIIKSHEKTLEELIKNNIKERFRQLLEEKIDENRVLTETALLLMKYGIGEELARLANHIEQFCNTLHRDVPVAKKLDFLCQEMNREINTIGSKSTILEISQAVIEAKDAVEKIREQLRNVE